MTRTAAQPEAASPAIRATLPYFGGKRTLAPRIVAEMGPHRAYAELFGGSLAVLMAKDEASMEIANDLYGSAINLARVVASERWRELLRRCARLTMHHELFLEAKALVRETEHAVAPSIVEVGDEHVDAAVWFFVRSWMGRNGSTGTGETNVTMARRYTSNGGSGGLRWHHAVRSIEWWHGRLSRVVFTNEDAIALAERLEDAEGWVYYADPPYLEKGTKYVHDFAEEDHARLAEALCAKRHARVLVSYYDDPRLDELYPGWTKLDFSTHKGLVNGGRRGSGERVKAPEVLLVNGPSLVGEGLFGGGGG